MNTDKIHADQLLRGALNWNQLDVSVRLREALEAGSDPDDFGALNPGALSPLAQAIRKHDVEAVAVLLSYGANPNGPIRQGDDVTAKRQAKGEACDGVRLGRPWAEKALRIEQMLSV